MREIKETWCAAGLRNIQVTLPARSAPYSPSALKGDKLGLVIDPKRTGREVYALPGGQYTAMRRSSPLRQCVSSTLARQQRTSTLPERRQAEVRAPYQFDGSTSCSATAQKEYCEIRRLRRTASSG